MQSVHDNEEDENGNEEGELKWPMQMPTLYNFSPYEMQTKEISPTEKPERSSQASS